MHVGRVGLRGTALLSPVEPKTVTVEQVHIEFGEPRSA